MCRKLLLVFVCIMMFVVFMVVRCFWLVLS